MPLAPEERMDLHVHPELKKTIIARLEPGQSMAEAASALLCAALGLDPAAYPVPRKTMGRRPGWRKKIEENGK